MNLFFTLWDVELQDNGYDIAIGDEFIDEFNISIIEDLIKFDTNIKTHFTHISNNKYQVYCYVYNLVGDIAFVEVNGLYFMIDLKDVKLEINTYYGFVGELFCDQWNYLGLSSEKTYTKYYMQFIISGKIKSLAFDTAPLKKISDRGYTSEGVIPKFDYMIEKSTHHGWGEGDIYPYTSGNYLVEIEINDLDIQRKRFIQQLSNLGVKK